MTETTTDQLITVTVDGGAEMRWIGGVRIEIDDDGRLTKMAPETRPEDTGRLLFLKLSSVLAITATDDF